MYKKTFTYKDFDGNTRTEDFYFNVSKPEVAKLQFSYKGGMDKYLQEIVDAEDLPAMYDFFSKLVEMSYGVKSEDGRRFIKDEQTTKEFMETEAYNEYLFLLMSNENEMNAFIEGALPDLHGLKTNDAQG